MLCGIPLLLTGEVLRQLDDMGHSDTLVVADANFPAHRLCSTVADLPAASAPAVVSAIRAVFPLDEGTSVQLMSTPDTHRLPVQEEILEAVDCSDCSVDSLGRTDFYEAAREAVVIIRTGETRPFGNVLLTKGVVPPTATTVKEQNNA